jgi:16S rRNA (guanine966-N2)-methyltransferase
LKGRSIRPTSNRVREALFNIVGSQPVDAVILDLFAGTGALGIEALSRGGAQAVFIDKAPATLDVLRKNIALCGLNQRSRTIRWDIVKNLDCLHAYHQAFNLVFIDPPYHRDMVVPTLTHLVAADALAGGARIVVEQDAREAAIHTGPEIKFEDERRYGQTRISFFTFSGHHIAS